MMHSQIILDGSLDSGPAIFECNKCNKPRQEKDGVYMGNKFICGSCWRKKAVVRANALNRSRQ